MTVALMCLAIPADATVLTTTELDAEPARWNGRSVIITGEVVGDYARRPDVVWVQINDDAYSRTPLLETGQLVGSNAGLGVRIPNELFDAAAWGRPGGYRTRGPVLAVTGVFRHADPTTGGDTFIDATDVELVSPSRPLEAPSINWTLVAVSVVAIAGGGALAALARWRRLNPE